VALRQCAELVYGTYRVVNIASTSIPRVWALVLALAVDSNGRTQLLRRVGHWALVGKTRWNFRGKHILDFSFRLTITDYSGRSIMKVGVSRTHRFTATVFTRRSDTRLSSTLGIVDAQAAAAHASMLHSTIIAVNFHNSSLWPMSPSVISGCL